jgi:DAK2 domain fusion protein YloV
MLGAAVRLLGQRSESINALNVFPVPDGDTGTNLLLTMRAAARAADEVAVDDVGIVAEAVARGALMGARGNSGVILSQYLRGLARGLGGQGRIDGVILATALELAAATARNAVANPVDGTMLSVATEVAAAALAESEHTFDLRVVLRGAADAGREAVARTRQTMPRLREAGVVAAGGLGLLTILEAMYLSYIGAELPSAEPLQIATPDFGHLESRAYGYCTEFLIRGQSIDAVTIKNGLAALGESLLVVGDEDIVRVHLHTFEPGRAIDLALRHGPVEQIKIENMQDQSERARELQVARLKIAACGLVAVSVGAGFGEVFKSLGATVVSGGTTLNPSTAEILAAVKAVSAPEVIVLPNSSNVMPAAQQARNAMNSEVTLVRTRNLAEGAAAALAFDAGRSAAENVSAMRRALADVRTGLLTRAIRSTTVDGRAIQAGDVLGLVDERIEVVASDYVEGGIGILTALGAEQAELVTLFVGEGADASEVERLRERVASELGPGQIEIVHGGQPHYRYILACE